LKRTEHILAFDAVLLVEIDCNGHVEGMKVYKFISIKTFALFSKMCHYKLHRKYNNKMVLTVTEDLFCSVTVIYCGQ